MQTVCRRIVSTVLLGFALSACGGGVSDGTGPVVPPIDTTKPPGGTVQRGTITIGVTIDTADAGVASAAGVGIAGLTVRLTRQLSSDPAVSATTGADGAVTFQNVLEGVYNVSVDRTLSATERERISSTFGDISVFAGATTVVFVPPQRQGVVALVASRRGSLIISELFTYTNPSGGPSYGYGTYLEVYNAADTTMYLDGVLIGHTWGGMHIGELGTSQCESLNFNARMDSQGLFLLAFIKFPGNGATYPIRPGEAKVIAMDALNHTVASPQTSQVDLSSADFEQHGNDADIDNPFVPDMIRVTAGTGSFGRGSQVKHGLAYALVKPEVIDRPDSNPLVTLSGASINTWRVAASDVLDVVAVRDAVPFSVFGTFVDCVPFISPAFDRDVSTIGDYYLPKAMRRKSLGFTQAGLEILQRTRTSSRDIEIAEPLRRSLNK